MVSNFQKNSLSNVTKTSSESKQKKTAICRSSKDSAAGRLRHDGESGLGGHPGLARRSGTLAAGAGAGGAVMSQVDGTMKVTENGQKSDLILFDQ